MFELYSCYANTLHCTHAHNGLTRIVLLWAEKGAEFKLLQVCGGCC